MLQTSHLQIGLHVEDEVAILALRGRLDLPLDADLLRTMERLIDEGFCRVVADFRGLDCVCPHGLSAFLAVHDDLRERGGDLKLVGDCPSGFFPLIQKFETPDEAIRAFRNPIVSSLEAPFFHAPSCPLARRIRQRRTFPSREAARDAGKRPCRRCRP